MAIELKMPALSPTMEKGTLAKWLVKVGDSVQSGDLLAEIETDKATMEFEAVDEGIIASIAVADGSEDVAVGTVIATLVEKGEEVTERVLEGAGAETSVAAPVAQPVSAPQPPITPKADPVPAAPAKPVIHHANATPLARRIAAFNGLTLESLNGTGPRGKVTKSDLGIPSLLVPTPDLVIQNTGGQAAPAYDPPAGVPVQSEKLSGMRKTIARRLTESKQTVPHFYLTVRCNIDPLLALRQELNAAFTSHGVKLSVNDMLIKAMAKALVDVPQANVQFGGDMLHTFGRVDIALAVAIDGGLVTPVIRDAGSLSLTAIAAQSKALATKAREGKLLPEDYTCGTASISNLGMFGIDEMFPVINPPHALILGIGAGVEQPWKVNGELALANIMAATASFDHRAIDGAIAAQFMAALREYIETPMRIVG